MNTWVFIIFAVCQPTRAKSEEHLDSRSSPTVYRKEYSSGSHDQVTGENSPRTIYIYPPDRGVLEEGRNGHSADSKYSGSINRPGVLHSRYLASSHEGDSTRTSQLNTLPLQSHGRHQENKNDRHEDSKYHGSSSDTASRLTNQPSASQDQHPSERVHAPHDGDHKDIRNEHKGNFKYDNSIRTPSLNNAYLSKTNDQEYGETSPSYSLPPSKVNQEQNHNGHPSDKHSPTFSENVPRATYVHIPHDEGNQDFRNEPRDGAKYHSSRSDSSLHNSFSTLPVDQSLGNTVPYRTYDIPPKNEKHEKRHPNHPSNTQVQISSESGSRDTYVQGHHEELHDDYQETLTELQNSLKYHNSKNNPSLLSSFPSKTVGQTLGDRAFHDTYALNSYEGNHERTRNSHHTDNQLQISSESGSRATYEHEPYDGGHKETRDEQQDTLKYHEARSNPSPHNSFPPKTVDEPLGEIVPESTYALNPYQGNHEQSRNAYHTSNQVPSKSVPRAEYGGYEESSLHNSFEPNKVDQTLGESAPHGTYALSLKKITDKQSHNIHPADNQVQFPTESVSRSVFIHPPHDSLSYHSSKTNPSFHTSFPSNTVDQSVDESAQHGTIALPLYKEKTHEQSHNGPHKSVTYDTNVHAPDVGSYRDEQQDSLKGHNHKTNPSLRNSFSSSTIDQSSGESAPLGTYVLPPYHGDYEREKNERQEDSKYHKSEIGSLADHNGFSLNYRGQSFDENRSRTGIVHSPHGLNHEEILDRHKINNAKHQNPTNNPAFSNHNSFPSNPDDHSLLKTTHKTDYESHQRDTNQHSPTNNIPAVFHRDISPNLEDKPLDKSTSRVNVVHLSNEGKPQQNRDAQHGDFNYDRPINNPPADFHNRISSNQHEHDQKPDTSTSRDNFPNLSSKDYHAVEHHRNIPSDLNYRSSLSVSSDDYNGDHSSNTHSQPFGEVGHQGNVLHSPQTEFHDGNQEDFKYTNRPSSSSASLHDEIASEPSDQSPDESVIRTVVINPHHKNHWHNHKGQRYDSKHVSLPRTPFTDIHDEYKANAPLNQAQSTHHFNPQAQQLFGKNTKESHEFGYRNPTTRPPKVHHSRYYEDTKGTGQHQYNREQSYKESHNKRLEQFENQDQNDFHKVQKGSFDKLHTGTHHINAQDHIRSHHKDPIINNHAPDQNGVHSSKSHEYDNQPSFPGHSALPQTVQDIHISKQPNSQQAQNQQFPKLESHSSQDVPEKSVHSIIHREYIGYVPYSGPYIRPQVLSDGRNNHEIASATVQPFGMPKAEPPWKFKSRTNLEGQDSTEHLRHDTHHVKTYPITENQHRENRNEPQNSRSNTFPGIINSQFSHQEAVYDDSIGSHSNPQGQVQRANRNQTDHVPVTARTPTRAGFSDGDEYGGHKSSPQRRYAETKNESLHKFAQSIPVTSFEHRKDDINDYNPSNFTRNEQIGTISRLMTNLTYPYEGEYVKRPASNDNDYHTKNHHESNPQISLKNYTRLQAPYDKRNLTQTNSPQTQTSYQNSNSYSDYHTSGQVRSSVPYPEQNVDQVPAHSSHVYREEHNSTNNEHVDGTPRPINNEVYLNAEDRVYSTGRGEDRRVQQGYASQAHLNAPFNNQQLHQNVPAPDNPLVTVIRAEPFVPARKVQTNTGQLDSYGNVKSYTSDDNSRPGIDHSLKFPFNEPKPALAIPEHFQFLSNQSDQFAVTPASQIYEGHLDSRNQHPSGLFGYGNTQRGYAPHMQYNTLPAVKPIVVQYKEDTHEISHAKHNHVHVHRSSQSGYQYGIIN